MRTVISLFKERSIVMNACIRISFAVVLTVLLVFNALPASAAGPVNPPVRNIPVTGNNLVNVSKGVITNFVLKSGDAVKFPSLSQSGLKTALSAETIKTLPGALPENNVFLEAISVAVVNNGKALDIIPENAKITVSFSHDVEYAMCDGDGALAIMHWDESKGWQEIAANTLETASAQPGVFALVRR